MRVNASSVDFRILLMSRCSNLRSATSLCGGSPGGTFGIPSSEDDEDDVRLVGE